MIILALDTTTDIASVALRKDGKTVSEEVVQTSDGHSYLIFQMIESALKEAGIGLAEVDCFASAIGPGSFTGVRICLAAAKGLAHAMNKPAAGISNLRALASLDTGDLRKPVIDARRGQIYTAAYDANLNLVSEEVVVVAEWEQTFSKEPLAAAIAMCAEIDGPDRWQDPGFLDANYVRRSDGDSFWVDAGSRAQN